MADGDQHERFLQASADMHQVLVEHGLNAVEGISLCCSLAAAQMVLQKMDVSVAITALMACYEECKRADEEGRLAQVPGMTMTGKGGDA